MNDKNVHPETREKILAAAQKLGYKPNPAALNLRYGQSKSIGFVVPEMTTPFSSKSASRNSEYFVSFGL